ncbi:ABC transporter substrate-binding protein [Saliphagus sp. GCM10025308]
MPYSDGDDGSQAHKQHGTGSLRRRKLLTAAGLAGATLIAGCSNSGDNVGGNVGNGGNGNGNGGNGNGGTSDAQTYFVTDVNTDPSSLDPHAVSIDEYTAWMSFPPNAYETLVFYDDENAELVPLLANEVPTVDNGLIKNDGQTFEFPLREGVTFHTGGEMLAEDVEFSLNRVVDMGVSDGVRNVERIDEIEVTDDYRIQLTLNEPYISFLNGIVPRKDLTVVSKQAVEENGGVQSGERNEWMAQNTAGTGPYYLEDWQRSQYIRWEAHEDYWDPDSVGPQGVFQHVVTEVSTAVSMMQQGQLHYSERGVGDVESFQGTGAAFTPYESLDQTFLFFNYDIPYDADGMPDDDDVDPDFFQDPNVRKAFGHAIDYEEYIEAAWDGYGYVSNQPCHLSPVFYYDEDAPNFEYDPELVEEYLREAGYWDGGFTITLMTEQISEFENAILYIKDSMESINGDITINTQALSESEYLDRRGDTPWRMPMDVGGFPSFGPDPAGYYDELFFGGIASGSRMSEYVSQEIFDLVEQAAAEPEEAAREEMYHELQSLCVDDPPVVALNGENFVTIHAECAEPTINPAFEHQVAKTWGIENCGDLNIDL